MSERHSQETVVEIVVEVEDRLLVVISKKSVGAEHSSGESTALLWAWCSLLVAIDVVVSRGLVNGAPLLPTADPASESGLGSRRFLLAVLVLVLFEVSSSVALGKHRAVARDMSCIVTAITNS